MPVFFYREHPSPLTLRRDKENHNKREQRAKSREQWGAPSAHLLFCQFFNQFVHLCSGGK